jgi:hypothetical protein
MNEQIKLLAEQAGFDCAPDGNVYHPDTGDQYPLDVYLEKFAELIVRECVSACYKQTPNWKGDYATAFGDGIEFCISGIKQHFGVEE